MYIGHPSGCQGSSIQRQNGIKSLITGEFRKMHLSGPKQKYWVLLALGWEGCMGLTPVGEQGWLPHSLLLSSVQSLSRVRLFATPWAAAHQASLSITNYWSLLKLTSIVSVMPSNHLILCRPLLLLPSIFPSIGVFSNESALRIRWPKCSCCCC